MLIQLDINYQKKNYLHFIVLKIRILKEISKKVLKLFGNNENPSYICGVLVE